MFDCLFVRLMNWFAMCVFACAFVFVYVFVCVRLYE